MSTEIMKGIMDAVHAAMKDGYYPEEDILNAPRLRVVPTKLRIVVSGGCHAIHMDSDEKYKEPFCIAI